MRPANVSEAASFTRLSTATIYAYVLKRRIPFIKIGARLVFDLDRLETWLAEHGHEPNDPTKRTPRARATA
jgi:excisionase family DNA binding protein